MQFWETKHVEFALQRGWVDRKVVGFFPVRVVYTGKGEGAFPDTTFNETALHDFLTGSSTL